MKGKRGRKSGGRRRGHRGGGRRRLAPSKYSRMGDFAACSDVVAEFEASGNTVYTLYNIALTNSPRAKAIAAGYQQYRINKVEVMWKPLIDTYVGTSSVPSLYYLVDKANTMTDATLANIKQAGARPHILNEWSRRCSFAPAINVASSDAVAGTATLALAGMVKTSPWLSTNKNAGSFPLPTPAPWVPNSVDHGGLVFCVEQNITGTQPVAAVEIRIHYQFRKPLWTTGAPSKPAVPIDLDNQDNVLVIEPPAAPLVLK